LTSSQVEVDATEPVVVEPEFGAVDEVAPSGTDADLLKSFNKALQGVYVRAKQEASYNASYYFEMLNHYGGLEAAHRLLARAAAWDGFTALWERQRLDLTVENVVLHLSSSRSSPTTNWTRSAGGSRTTDSIRDCRRTGKIIHAAMTTLRNRCLGIAFVDRPGGRRRRAVAVAASPAALPPTCQVGGHPVGVSTVARGAFLPRALSA
jgi:hypothetical protein